MLDSTVLHQSHHGARGESDVVGISWKAATKSHPSPSLVVTCAHQVVVYKVSARRFGLLVAEELRLLVRDGCNAMWQRRLPYSKSNGGQGSQRAAETLPTASWCSRARLYPVQRLE